MYGLKPVPFTKACTLHLRGTAQPCSFKTSLQQRFWQFQITPIKHLRNQSECLWSIFAKYWFWHWPFHCVDKSLKSGFEELLLLDIPAHFVSPIRICRSIIVLVFGSPVNLFPRQYFSVPQTVEGSGLVSFLRIHPPELNYSLVSGSPDCSSREEVRGLISSRRRKSSNRLPDFVRTFRKPNRSLIKPDPAPVSQPLKSRFESACSCDFYIPVKG